MPTGARSRPHRSRSRAVWWSAGRRDLRWAGMPTESAPPQRQPLWFLLVLALASAGGAVAYVPFLTVLLPVRITEIAQGENVASLAYVTFAGAIVASQIGRASCRESVCQYV